MNREEFKKQLLEGGLSEEQAEQILESFDKYKTGLDESFEQKIEEAIQETKVELEKKRLEELDEQKVEAEKKLEEELKVYEQRLAERVKALVEAKLESHGDQIISIMEKNEARKGSEILEEIGEYVEQAKKDIAENSADPEEVASLKKTITEQKSQIEDLSEQVNTEKARANVTEADLKELKESIDDAVSVTIEEDDKDADGKPVVEAEDTITDSAEADHPDSQPTVTEDDDDDPKSGKVLTEGMKRMRQLAGITEQDE